MKAFVLRSTFTGIYNNLGNYDTLDLQKASLFSAEEKEKFSGTLRTGYAFLPVEVAQNGVVSLLKNYE